MNINTNTWNKIRYTLYTPVYDLAGKFFSNSRKESIKNLNIKAGDKVLLVGAGTGLDIVFIPENAEIVATDITPAMVRRIRIRFPHAKAEVMDGQQLLFPDNHFDHIILHLIIAVIPDPVTCLKEAERVLKKDGKIAVFDKFISDKKPTLFRKIFNLFTNLFFSDITRNIEQIVSQTNLKIIKKEKADLGGKFQILLLQE